MQVGIDPSSLDLTVTSPNVILYPVTNKNILKKSKVKNHIKGSLESNSLDFTDFAPLRKKKKKKIFTPVPVMADKEQLEKERLEKERLEKERLEKEKSEKIKDTLIRKQKAEIIKLENINKKKTIMYNNNKKKTRLLLTIYSKQN